MRDIKPERNLYSHPIKKYMKKSDLKNCLIKALEKNNGKAKLVTVCKFIWANYKKELEESGDLFYTWQYDVRWAALQLRKEGIMKSAEEQQNHFWELAEKQFA